MQTPNDKDTDDAGVQRGAIKVPAKKPASKKSPVKGGGQFNLPRSKK